VESGGGITSVTPVYQGYILKHASSIMEVCMNPSFDVMML